VNPRFLLLILTCAILAAGCGSSETSAPPTAIPQPSDTPAPAIELEPEPNRHYEPVGGFSFVPPEGWQMIEASGLAFKAAIGPIADEFAPNISVLDEAFDGSLDAYASLGLDNMQQFFENLVLVSEGAFQPDEGSPGVRIVVESVQGGRRLRQAFYFFDGGATKFILTGTQLADSGKNWDAMFDESAGTFRFESE